MRTLILLAFLASLAHGSGLVENGVAQDDWWCRDGLCNSSGRCRSDCEVEATVTAGAGDQSFQVRALKCADITTVASSPPIPLAHQGLDLQSSSASEATKKIDGNSCYMCCGNSRNCRYGAAKWSSFFAATEGGASSCVCCFHHQDPESPYFYRETHGYKDPAPHHKAGYELDEDGDLPDEARNEQSGRHDHQNRREAIHVHQETDPMDHIPSTLELDENARLPYGLYLYLANYSGHA